MIERLRFWVGWFCFSVLAIAVIGLLAVGVVLCFKEMPRISSILVVVILLVLGMIWGDPAGNRKP